MLAGMCWAQGWAGGARGLSDQPRLGTAHTHEKGDSGNREGAEIQIKEQHF